MKKSNVYALFAIVLGLLFVQGCDSDDGEPVIPSPTTSSDSDVSFDFYLGDKKMNLQDTFYLPGGDTLTFEEFKILISNLKLIGGNDTANVEMYELVKVEEDSSPSTFILKDLPVGSYKGLSFYIGLDSATNYKPASSPALFVDEGMYWTWADGHKFINVSGKIVSDTIQEVFKSWLFHIGTNDNLREVRFDQDFEVPVSGVSITLKVQVESLFSNPKILNPSNNYRAVMGGSRSRDVADNYATGMILLESINSK